MARINKVIDLLEQDQPVYYASTAEMTYENGVRMASTWADYIRLDFEHGPFDMIGLGRFMQGLKDAGPTASGHQTPAIVAELPVPGICEEAIRYNSWMINHLLAQGVHGLILCHAETAGAVRAFVECSRYPFHRQGVGQGLDMGRRGHGGQASAAKLWGLSPEEYMRVADVWPLNPEGELVLGIKAENIRALDEVEESVRVPGLCYAEWGSGDMCMSFGHRQKPPRPYPEDIQAAMDKVWRATTDAGVNFLSIVNAEDVTQMIDRGVRFCRAYDPQVAETGRAYTKRRMPC